jgi:PilZ domain
VSDEYDDGYEDEYELETADRRSGDQRREAFRIAMNMSVYVDEPMERYCELVDISVLGLRLDRELPCTPGVKIYFRLVIPSYGATPKPTEMELSAEVVRVEGGFTGLQLVELQLHQTRAVRDLVHSHQRRLLLAERPAALDRRQTWLQR